MGVTPIGRSEPLSDKASSSWMVSHWPLIAIVLASFIVRLVATLGYTGFIDGEGSEYGRMAQNLLSGVGYVGVATGGKQLFFPPLYPLLIAGVSVLTGDAEIAARTISVVMGTLLVLPVYFIARRLYGEGVALGAAALVGAHPYLVQFSTTAYCELFFMVLVLTAIYMAMRSWDEITPKRLVLMGALYGMAYLVRPEALGYAVIAGALLVLRQFVGTPDRRPSVGIQITLLAAGFLVFAVPYTVWLSAQVGHFMLQGKSIVNLPTEKRMQQGMSEYEAAFGVAPDLKELGVWMIPNSDAVKQFDIKPSEMPLLLAKRGARLASNLLVTLGSSFSFGAPALLGLVILGLFARPWAANEMLDQLHLLFVLALGVVGLLFTYALQIRFYILFVPLFCIWAAQGIVVLCQWMRGTLLAANAPLRFHTPMSIGIAAVAVLAVLLPSAMVAAKAMKLDRGMREAKERLVRFAAEQPKQLHVAATWTSSAFHMRSAFTWLPYIDGATARRYLDKTGVTHVVLWEGEEFTPYTKLWAEQGVPNARLVLQLTNPASPDALKVYELLK